jgi:hypothetical protein
MKAKCLKLGLMLSTLVGSAAAYAAGTGCCDDLLCCLKVMVGCC